MTKKPDHRIQLPTLTYQRICAASKAYGITNANFVSMCVFEYLRQQKLLHLVPMEGEE